MACYNTAFVESKKPLTKFNNDSWWFFTAGDFKIIANYLDIEIIIDNFNKLIGETPEITPEVVTSSPTTVSTTEESENPAIIDVSKEGEGEKLATSEGEGEEKSV